MTQPPETPTSIGGCTTNADTSDLQPTTRDRCRSRAVAQAAEPPGITHAEVSPNIATTELPGLAHTAGTVTRDSERRRPGSNALGAGTLCGCLRSSLRSQPLLAGA